MNLEPVETAVHHCPASIPRPAISDLPSPVKSPTLTSTQVIVAFQVVQKVVLNDEPVERPVHHCPASFHLPAMSVLPSPSKSPTFTSTQVTLAFQVSQSWLA